MGQRWAVAIDINLLFLTPNKAPGLASCNRACTANQHTAWLPCNTNRLKATESKRKT